jgi:hypothetical protein
MAAVSGLNVCTQLSSPISSTIAASQSVSHTPARLLFGLRSPHGRDAGSRH